MVVVVVEGFGERERDLLRERLVFDGFDWSGLFMVSLMMRGGDLGLCNETC